MPPSFLASFHCSGTTRGSQTLEYSQGPSSATHCGGHLSYSFTKGKSQLNSRLSTPRRQGTNTSCPMSGVPQGHLRTLHCPPQAHEPHNLQGKECFLLFLPHILPGFLWPRVPTSAGLPPETAIAIGSLIGKTLGLSDPWEGRCRRGRAIGRTRLLSLGMLP